MKRIKMMCFLLALLGLGEETITLQPTALAALWPRLQAACPGVPLQLPACDAAVQADADLLLDLLCNLVGNAVKASEPGQPVEVQAADNGDTVTLTASSNREDFSDCIEKYGAIPAETEKTFTVSGLNEYVTTPALLTDTVLDSLKAQAEEVICRELIYG